MNITLPYTIKLLTDWHIGSGLDAGTNVDALVAKTENQLPFIPGKTIKGLLRDAMNDMVDVGKAPEETIYKIFGTRSKPNSNVTSPGNAFFSNAYLPEREAKEISNHQLQAYLYRAMAATRINEKGTAQSGSLRSMQVCIPLQLEGSIILRDATDKEALINAAKLVRHLGVQRNRGLGRCRISII